MKRQKFIHFKQTFFQRHDHLKKNGQKLHTVVLLEQYINDNLDDLYKKRVRVKDNDDYEKQTIQMRKIIMAQELEAIPEKELSVKQKWQIERDKKRYA